MTENNRIAVYPDDDVATRVLEYREQHSLSKTKAGEELIRKGLDAHERTFLDDIYVELAKICGIVGLLLLMIVAVSDGGALPFNPIYVSFVFIAASFVFMIGERYGPGVRSLLPGKTASDTDDDAIRG